MADDSGNGWRGRMEAHIEDVGRRLVEIEKHPFVCPQIKVVSDHEERIRRLENMRWQIAGVIAAAQAIGVGVILAAMKGLVK